MAEERRGDRSEASTLLLMAATFLSRLLGILKSRLIALVFGSGTLSDAMNFSYNLSNNFRKLFAEGSLSSSYIPLFASCDDDGRTARLYRQVASFLILIFALIITAVAIFARPIMAALSDFEGEGLEVAAFLLPPFTLFLFFISLATLSASILQTKRRFLASGIAPIFFTLAMLLSLWLLSDDVGYWSMAIGAVAGSLAQLAIVLIDFRKLGIRFRLDFHFASNEDFRTLMRSWLPASASSLVAIASQSVTMYLASRLEAGSVTALSNAIVFYSAPYGIVFASVNAVYFPLISRRKDERGRAAALSDALVNLTTFLLPAALILASLSRECVASLLQGGAFTLDDTVLTACVLTAYLAAMLPMAFYAMLQRWMYSTLDYWRNLAVAVAVSLADIAFTLFYMSQGLGVVSMPLASFSSSLIGTLCLFPFVHGFDWRRFIHKGGRVIIANIPLVATVVLYGKWNPQFYTAGSTLRTLVLTILAGLGMLAVALASYIAFKVDFLSALRNRRP